MLPGAIDALNRPEIYCAWRGPSLVVLDARGRAGFHGLTGYFFRETRFLSRLALTIQEEEPFPCSLAEIEANRLEYTYVYPPLDIGAGGGSGSGGQSEWKGILRRGLDLRLVVDVHPSGFEVNAWVTSRWNESSTVELAWELDADYADMPEAQSGRRQQRAEVTAHEQPDGVKFVYGHPKLPFETLVTATGPGEWKYAAGRLRSQLTLARQSPVNLSLRIRAIDHATAMDETQAEAREQKLRRWQQNAARVHAPAETPLAGITNRAVQDVGSFALLDGPENEWLTPAAGVPLYLSLWGRDALTAVWQACVFDRGEMAEAALAAMARLQGHRVDPDHDEEPGRIIQQARSGPLDRLGQSPFARYYADYASPFDYIFAFAHAYACKGERQFLDRYWKTATAILDWAREYADKDKDGYLEYVTSSKKGPRHQGWKDSDNAVVYADGRQVSAPIAACEVQGYYFASLQVMAVLAAIRGEVKLALRLWNDAAELKKRFNRDFWVEPEGFVAFGLDAGKRQIDVLTSNAAQCLATGIVEDDHIPRLVRRLFEPDLFSGWGLRTLSAKNPAYNPLDYHLGSVWLVENATAVFGLRRFGYDEQAIQLTRALYDLALIWRGHRVPECVGGYSRAEMAHPGAYPRANTPQMWNQSAWPLIMQCLLGLEPAAPLNLLGVDPVLPPWLPALTIKGLRVGDSTVSIRFEREVSGGSSFEVIEREGDLKVVRQQPVNALNVGLVDRVLALANIWQRTA